MSCEGQVYLGSPPGHDSRQAVFILQAASVRPDAAGNLRPEEGWAGRLSDRICGPSYAGPAHYLFADQLSLIHISEPTRRS